MGFPIGARGKWHDKNSELILALGLSKMRLGKIVQALPSRGLLSSVDVVHMFVSKAHSIVPVK